MSVHRRFVELGGVATYRQVVAVVGRREFARAISSGEIVRTARGRFALAGVESAVMAAHALGGALSHGSAAMAWGWALKSIPDRPHVTVPVKRKIRAGHKVHLHRRDLGPESVADGRTSRDLTIEQCLRTMPYDEALCVADSALREGYSPHRLVALARDARGPGSAMLRRVAGSADGRSANPFESTLRALAQEVPGLHVEPQVVIGTARVDLADRDLRLVLEADSFAWHGDRRSLRRDAHRYNELVAGGWTVLRFSWEHVMFEGSDVRSQLMRAAGRAGGRSKGGSGAGDRA